MKLSLQEIHSNYEGFSKLIQLVTQTAGCFCEKIELDMSQVAWMDANMCAPLGAVLYKVGRDINTIRLTNIPASVEAILSKNGFLQLRLDQKK